VSVKPNVKIDSPTEDGGKAKYVRYEICTLMGYYAGRSGNSVPTFRDKISVLSSTVSKSFLDLFTVE
jgi:hypothetical protein